MAGYAGGQNDMGNGSLDSLFAQLRQQSANSPAAPPSQQTNMAQFYGNPYFNQQQQHQPPPPNTHTYTHPHPPRGHGYQQPSVSSPLPTPPIHGQQPYQPSAIMSPGNEAAQRSSKPDERTNNLLNLLKFSQPSSSTPASSAAPQTASREPRQSFGAVSNNGSHSRAASGTGNDLIAALMGSSVSRGAQQPSPQPRTHVAPSVPTPQPQPTFRAENEAPPSDTQAYLLQLLNRPKPAQSDSSSALEPARSGSSANIISTQSDVNDLAQVLKSTSIEKPKPTIFGNVAAASLPTVDKGVFTYINPFEQLAASSPRNRTPKSATPAIQILKREAGDNKRKVVDERTPTASPAHTKRKMDVPEPLSPVELPDGRTRLDALMGIGAPPKTETTVSQALSEMGNSVDQQVEDAIVKAEADVAQATIEQDFTDMLNSKTEQEFEENAQVAASAIKQELEKDGNEHILEESMPAEIAEVVKDIIDDAAAGHVADDWEHDAADETPLQDETECAVKVYNLPMKPFISLTLKPLPEDDRPTFRDESLMDIARLKKEFDQIDRTLVTSTNHFIVYCMSKNGGIRVIRQDDGKDLKLFTETHDRVFSVAVSASEADLTETIIGTGISGTVYWAAIKEGEVDHLSEEVPEQYGFALPPLQTQDEGSPGGMLKTRARKSSCHPDFFAVGRGRSIHIIWPSVVMNKSHGYVKAGSQRLGDTEKYLSNRSLKINTGKAGKDFTFSQDDTTIVSLDKAGRVKFWDVRTLTNTNRGEQKYPTPEQIEPVEIKDPLMTLLTTAPNEKSWPTSVLFVDKLRPYQKGGALRYLIIGMKQNHTLQLWDLALGKPVQELHLPHEKESDAVCSVMYHASTGIIVVGHPTRNSIYLIHLSSPKYNLSKTMSQAEFTQKLVNNDSSLPKPDSTAVMSGIREYSFATKGQLRSLDILQSPLSSITTAEDSVLFELYAMHSKGVTCLAIKHEDLGWNAENKVLHPVDALKAEVITIEGLKPIPLAPVTDDRSDAGSPAPSRAQIRSPEKSMVKEVGRKIILADRTKPMEAGPSSTPPAKATPEQWLYNPATPSTNGQETPTQTEKVGKNKKKKAAAAAATNAQIQQRNASPVKIMKNSAIDNEASSKPVSISNGPADRESKLPANLGISQEAVDSTLKALESSVSSEVNRIVGNSLDTLYKRIDDDKRTAAAVSDAKQDAMLRLVSSTLSDNVQKTLAAIVNDNITKSVVPAISTSATKAVNEQLATNLKNALPKELKSVLPDAIAKALKQPELLKSMSDSLARSVAFKVEENFANILQQTVTPAFSALAVQTSQKVAGDIQRKANEQIAAIERARLEDSIKIEQLTKLVTGLSEMVSTMATAQTKFQGEILRMQQQKGHEMQTEVSSHVSNAGEAVQTARGHSAQNSSVSGPRSAPLSAPLKQEHDSELESSIQEISSLMNAGDYENAIVKWLQTGREQEIFIKYFSNFHASFANELSPLLLLSVAATVSADMEDVALMQRLAWLETALQTFQPYLGDLDEQTRSVTPKIMSILHTRLEHLFMRVTSVPDSDTLLKRISTLIKISQRVNDVVQMPVGNAW